MYSSPPVSKTIIEPGRPLVGSTVGQNERWVAGRGNTTGARPDSTSVGGGTGALRARAATMARNTPKTTALNTARRTTARTHAGMLSHANQAVAFI